MQRRIVLFPFAPELLTFLSEIKKGLLRVRESTNLRGDVVIHVLCLGVQVL